MTYTVAREHSINATVDRGRPSLQEFVRAALMGTTASVAILASLTTPAVAACDTATAQGVILVQCSGTMTGTNVPAVSYSSNVDAFEILSSAKISTTGAGAFGIYGYGQGPYVLVNSTGSIITTTTS